MKLPLHYGSTEDAICGESLSTGKWPYDHHLQARGSNVGTKKIVLSVLKKRYEQACGLQVNQRDNTPPPPPPSYFEEEIKRKEIRIRDGPKTFRLRTNSKLKPLQEVASYRIFFVYGKNNIKSF